MYKYLSISMLTIDVQNNSGNPFDTLKQLSSLEFHAGSFQVKKRITEQYTRFLKTQLNCMLEHGWIQYTVYIHKTELRISYQATRNSSKRNCNPITKIMELQNILICQKSMFFGICPKFDCFNKRKYCIFNYNREILQVYICEDDGTQFYDLL